MEIKNGDTVLVRCKVQDAEPMNGTGVLVKLTDYWATIPHANIVSVEERPLQVGDRVKDPDNDEGTIVAICCDEAWVDFGGDIKCLTVAIDDLRRA